MNKNNKMNKPNLAEINQAFFLCEGSFEKDALNWIIEENRLIYSKDQIDLSYINYRSKKKEMLNKILEYETDTNSAIIYIHDSNNEVFSLPKNEKQFLKDREIKIIDVITKPEIEILAILSDTKLYQKWNKTKNTSPSSFCKANYGIDTKKKGACKELFKFDFSKFERACSLYTEKCNTKFGYSLIELIKKL